MVKETFKKAQYSEQRYHNYVFKYVNTDISIYKENFKLQMHQHGS